MTKQYKSLGIPSLNKAYLQRALLDENVQYLLLALYWNFGGSIPSFSLFIMLHYWRVLLSWSSSHAAEVSRTCSLSDIGKLQSHSMKYILIILSCSCDIHRPQFPWPSCHSPLFPSSTHWRSSVQCCQSPSLQAKRPIQRHHPQRPQIKLHYLQLRMEGH